ncbi:zinc ribbon domain-containing protein [Lentzea californiensis]|uniref:zinc ribbon domain-containing protein n=1 Tax=Lentzea californiensis TaxID=438851 RepID=UPI0027E1C61D|nr:zinc ribbon domain-containing protein [Lentzea californiensis]
MTFAVDTDAPAPLEPAGQAIGVDLGLAEFAVTSRNPSGKTCSACGHRLAELALSARHWTCPSCRTRHDRDHNAAKNILAAGRAVARDNSADACGADVGRQGPTLPQSAVKQETCAARYSP